MSTCPADALGQSQCAGVIRTILAEIAAKTGRRCEIVISTAPPLVASPYGANGYECPHGVTYWIEPTGEQIAEWRREQVP